LESFARQKIGELVRLLLEEEVTELFPQISFAA
jgi:hypothetical protein